MKKQWWHGKTAYQIYPKSFCDSNGDGIGDLPGIISKLDYLKDLGIDILWLSPIYRSPFVDQGYDIADYYDIDPVFGTMEDMDRLLAETKKRGMYVLMDLVVNHCSDQHELFQKALADPYGEYGSYFYFRKGNGNGKPPCNWRSYFGGSVWEPVPDQEDLWYLHMFAKEQPDLNWENPIVRERIYDMINWWLDRGLAGFRIDAIINIKKDLRFADFPADRADGLCSHANMLLAAQGVGDFLTEMRDRTFRPHNALAIAEAFNIKDGELADFCGEDGYFTSIFDFGTEILFKSSLKGWYHASLPTVTQVRDTFYESQARIGDTGFYCNITENHDEPRGASRYLPADGQNDAGKKLLALTLFMRKGMPFLYQGQEIGMENYPFRSVDEIEDINTLDEYQVALDAGLSPEEALAAVNPFSRDNARTPVQWSHETNAGFTDGTPWFPVNPNYSSINVADQSADPDSVLNFYRKLSALRKDPAYRDVIVYGDFVPFLQEVPGLYAFHRCNETQDLVVLGNMSNETVTVTLPAMYEQVLINNLKHLNRSGANVTLEPYQAVILK